MWRGGWLPGYWLCACVWYDALRLRTSHGKTLHPTTPHITHHHIYTPHRHTGCCIFHKKRAFGESSSESDSDDEGGADGGGAGDGQGGGGDKDGHMRIAQPKHPPVRPWETYHA